jgi:hypothetical protein
LVTAINDIWHGGNWDSSSKLVPATIVQFKYKYHDFKKIIY